MHCLRTRSAAALGLLIANQKPPQFIKKTFPDLVTVVKDTRSLFAEIWTHVAPETSLLFERACAPNWLAHLAKHSGNEAKIAAWEKILHPELRSARGGRAPIALPEGVTRMQDADSNLYFSFTTSDGITFASRSPILLESALPRKRSRGGGGGGGEDGEEEEVEVCECKTCGSKKKTRRTAPRSATSGEDDEEEEGAGGDEDE